MGYETYFFTFVCYIQPILFFKRYKYCSSFTDFWSKMFLAINFALIFALHDIALGVTCNTKTNRKRKKLIEKTFWLRPQKRNWRNQPTRMRVRQRVWDWQRNCFGSIISPAPPPPLSPFHNQIKRVDIFGSGSQPLSAFLRGESHAMINFNDCLQQK
jgi:hypothetical protein